MLVIRLQRIGRKGLPLYRLIVQDSQKHPSSGKVVEYVGNYNPHTKVTNLEIERLQHFLDHGAQPTDRVISLLKVEKKIKLPEWVKTDRTVKTKSVRKPEKLRKNQTKSETAPDTSAEA